MLTIAREVSAVAVLTAFVIGLGLWAGLLSGVL